MKKMKYPSNNFNRSLLFALAINIFLPAASIAQPVFREEDKVITIEPETRTRYRLGISAAYNRAVHDYDNLNIASDYCSECFANGSGDGYSLGAAVEYLLAPNAEASPSVFVRINYEYLPAIMSSDEYKIPAIVYKNEYDYEKVFATMDYRAEYELQFFSADILYKVNLPGTGLFAFLGPSINYNTSHRIMASFELKEPVDKMLPKPFDWLEKRYKYDSQGRRVVYDEDIVREGNYTRVGFKAGISFPIELEWIIFNPFFQFYYSFRNYDSYEESQITAWSLGADIMLKL